MRFWHQIVYTWFGLGLIRRAPGTWGSLGAYPLCWLFCAISKPERFWWEVGTVLLVLSIIGAIAIRRFHEATRLIDHKSVVVDEVIGQFLAFAITIKLLLAVPTVTSPLLANLCENISVLCALAFFLSFPLFRFFDIVKPLCIGWADREINNAFGVIFDDILAGLAAGLVVWLGLAGWQFFV